MKKLITILCMVTVLCSMFSMPAMAASGTRKCYLIQNQNTTVYSNTGLTKKYGTVYGSDELKVLSVTSRYCKVQYYISGSRTKTGYIATSAILTATSGSTYTAKAKITTYRRPGGTSYGYISKGDNVMILGTYSTYTQIKYPYSGGYKYAFITTSNADTYLKGSGYSYSTITEGVYKISTALNSSYCLDVHNYATENGGNVEIYPYHGTKNEQFQIKSAGNGWYYIIDTNSSKAIDVKGGSSASQTNVQIYEQNNSSAQKWAFISAGSGYYYIKNALGCYLDVQSGVAANAQNVWVYTYNGSDAQKFSLSKIEDNTKTNSSNLSEALYKNSSAYISCGFDGYVNTKGRHEGIDIKCGLGMSVYSLTDGVITRVTKGSNGSNGLSTIAIYNSSLNKTIIYLHTAPISSLYVGQSISKGQLIATESWRGISSSTSSHTHVEVRNGKKTAAAKSVGDYTLSNSNPTSFWTSLGYKIK